MANHSLRYGSRSAGSHRRAPSTGTVRVRVVRGILAAALVLGGGIAATCWPSLGTVVLTQRR